MMIDDDDEDNNNHDDNGDDEQQTISWRFSAPKYHPLCYQVQPALVSRWVYMWKAGSRPPPSK
eukprot:5296838-Prorocentrum_lima.AAC.1